MSARRVVIASPIEPSGASWLLNCMLELGIKVRHRPLEGNVWRNGKGQMWVPREGGFRLHPMAEPLKKWLPALHRQGPFAFRDDVEIEYVQDFPSSLTPALGGDRTVFFVRDPRDAIYSAYRRQAPELTYGEFLAWPNSQTLLDRVGHFDLFARAWLNEKGVVRFRFEDYKADDRATLNAVLDVLGLAFSEAEVDHAIGESTFEKAREGEARYQARYPQDAEVANRAGRVGDWKGRPELGDAARRIELGAADLLARLGYGPNVSAQASGEPAQSADEKALDFARKVDAPALMRAALPAHEIRELLDTLAGRVRAWAATRPQIAEEAPELEARLGRLRDGFSDGSLYHLARVRALVASRRPARAEKA